MEERVAIGQKKKASAFDALQSGVQRSDATDLDSNK